MLNPPSHLRSANIAKRDVPYAWDEWNIKAYYWDIDPAEFTKLDALTNQANLGLTIASAEWIVERFALLDRDPRLLQFLEAAWAAMANRAYCRYYETRDDEWRGPIRGPLAVTLTIVNDALFCLADDPSVATRSCWIRNLARHVVTPTDIFENWYEACVRRLEQHHTWSLEGRGNIDFFADLPFQGRDVPREAYDLTLDYKPEATPALIDAFLQELRPSENPFLRSPSELFAVEEIRTPYRYP